MTILLGKGDGTFTAQPNAQLNSTGGGPLTVADFNGDGIPDIAVGNDIDDESQCAQTGCKVSILLGKGDGTFTLQSEFPDGYDNTEIISRDFDGDGIPDLAVLSGGDSTVTVALGNGDGTFDSVKTIALDGVSPIGLVSADFNHDGALDLAVTVAPLSNSNGTTKIDLLVGTGDGTFTTTSFPVTGQISEGMVSADFNGDGIPDLVVVSHDARSVTCLLGDDHGGFRALPTLTLGYDPIDGLYLGDFNGDGLLDLLNGSVLYGKGDGTFTEVDTPVVIFGTTSLTVADFNGDGFSDIAGPRNSASVDQQIHEYIQLSQPSHSFSLGVSLPGGQHSIVASYSGDSSYQPSASTPVTLQNVTAIPGIFPGSGYIEAPQKVTITDATPGAAIYYSIGEGAPPTTASTLYTGPFYVSGLNQEYIYATATGPTGYLPSESASVSYSAGQASQTILDISPGDSVEVGTPVTLAAHVTSTPAFHQGVVLFCNAAAAHCEDSAILGSAQLVAGGWAKLRLQLSVGTYSIRAVFQGAGEYTLSASEAQTLVVRGKSATSTGVVSAEQTNGLYKFTSQVAVFGKGEIGGTLTFKDSINGASPISLGSATLSPVNTVVGFRTAAAVATGANPSALAVGDFNRDGIPDLVIANTDDKTVSIMQGNGDGTFKEVSKVSLSGTPISVAVGDINGDGFQDIAVAAPYQYNQAYIYLLYGSSSGAFTYGGAIDPRGFTDYVRLADLNGDGVVDIITLGTVETTFEGLFTTNGAMSVFYGPSYGSPIDSSIPYPAEPASVAITDFNGDGINDLATSNMDGTVSILLNSSRNYIDAPTLSPGSHGKLISADFNGDGIPDLAAPGVNSIVIYLGKGDGTFTLASSPSATNMQDFEVADFNGDGISDLIVTELINNQPSVVVFLGAGDGTFPHSTMPTATPFITSPVVADFNGDGLPDLAALDQGSNTMGALLTNLTTPGTLDGITLSKPGTHVITVTYSGTSALAPSVGSPLTIIVPAPNFASLAPVPVRP